MSSGTPPAAVADPERLAALHATALLDSPAEAAFDRLTRLASRLLRAPVALVSLVDADRQFFKSCVGLPEPWASARQTPLSHSFCRHAVELRAPLVISDAREHPLVRDNLGIPDLGVIAYAGIPLTTGDGHTLGSFCVIDHEPRQWTDDEIATLGDLASAAVTEIELRAALRRAEDARAEAAAANRAKDDFLALVNHELRTPLSGIASNAQMLAMGICGPVTEQQARAVERIRLSQHHLTGLIAQLLDFKRIAAGHVDYDVVVVTAADAIGAAAAIVESELEERALRFEHREPQGGVAVRADPDKLRQVLVNLLANAAKFTPAGGSVILDCDGNGDAEVVRITVRDTGIGIPADQLDAVFEPFVQVKDARRPAAANGGGGTGLGLAISRALARGMGGDLTAESTPGVGSAFTVTLPAA
ncbi:MAG TPA: GAF domain-containing sensor histidine kinase [Gemmatimonadaceae bacterium]|nr:GAF domain-containing sensor histidine kinase [Gemmatimonadaceae bacterium]